jgi:cytochrome c oxidase assembly protein subunit 15
LFSSLLASTVVAVPTLSPAAYRRVTLLALLALVVIVVSGAAVRLSGSGLGCTDWPTCEEGRLAPESVTDGHAIIEFANRAFTGVVSVAVALAVLGALRRRPPRRDLTALAVGLVVGVAAQAVLGGLVVWYGLSPWFVMAHFLLSLVLVADAVVLHHRAGSPPGAARPVVGRAAQRLGWLVVLAAAAAVTTGTVVTATGPHAGDDSAERFDLALPDVARVHGVSVVVLLGLVLALLRVLWRDGAPAPVTDAARVLLLVLVAQAVVGYTQWFTGVPALLVGMHVLGAVAVWVAVLRTVLALRAVPVVREAEGPVVAPAVLVTGR